jgi:DNA-binding NarL/FixJ family response regulator
VVTPRVAVVDNLPTYRRGLVSALADAGFAGEEPADPFAWVQQAGGLRPGARDLLGPRPMAAMLMSVGGEGMGLLGSLCQAACGVTVVALLPESTPAAYRAALRVGATAAALYSSAPEMIVAVLRAALDGDTRLPAPIAQAIAAGRGVDESAGSCVSPREAEWLRILAQGAHVVELARQAGYSERAMYRLLGQLFERMRVANRHEAILQADRWGLLEASRG